MAVMIEQVDEQLKNWLASIVGGVEVSLAAPVSAGKGRAIGLYLLELIQAPVLRGSKPPPLQILLRYLVTADAERPEDAHRMLGDLIFAAMDSPDLEVESEPVPLALWSALGVAPRPAFILRAPARVERPQPKARRVGSLVITQAPLAPLDGVVLGPGGVPLAGAEVELPALQLFTRTDYKGRFRFPTAAPGKDGTFVRVKARGFEMTATATDGERRGGEPLVVRFERMED
ncbi:MAG: hypothetical protein ACLQJR_16030 [Stellaceae bacterium]